MTEPLRTVRFNFLALMLCSACTASALRGATLSGRFDPIPTGTNINLTAEGPLDWVHWGLITEFGFDRKAGVTPQIPDFVPIGFNGPYWYNDNRNGYSWSDGTPAISVTNTLTGVWMYAKRDGFELDVPADTNMKTLKVYVGTFAAVGAFEARLIGTALSYSDSSITNACNPLGSDLCNGPGGVYTLDYVADSAGQTLRIRFTVGDAYRGDGNVTLQAAALTAPGANNPPVVSITDPADSTNFAAPANVTITANASDVDTNGAVTLVEFFEGATKLGESTGSPYRFAWNSVPPGNYSLTAKATDNGGATRTSAPLGIFVNGTGGVLSGHVGLPPIVMGHYPVDLTADGTADWAHWGLVAPNSFNHKAGVAQQINFTIIGTNNTQRLDDYFAEFSWSDGTPTGTASLTTSGVFINGSTTGFRITAPADTSGRMLKVYVGLFGAEGKFRAYLSDYSAPAYTDTSLGNTYGRDFAVYALDYRAASSGQTLIVEYTARTLFDVDYGNVALVAATLSGVTLPTNTPPTVAITNPTSGATFTAPASIAIAAEASDSDGTVTLVEFFQSDTKLGEATNSPYTFDWTNVTAGTYMLTAKVTDNLGATNTSAPVSVAVASSNALPTVTITSPTNSATFTAPANIAITAEASDSDGTVSLVEFFENDTRLGAVTNSPYNFDWTNVAAGNYTLTAKATDSLGAVVSSSPISILITNSPVHIQNLTINEGTFQFSFATQAGLNYTVQFTDSAEPANWQVATNFNGTGAIISVTNVISSRERFYRVGAQ
jgi:hypothetical protein